jgi:hypothetical protein
MRSAEVMRSDCRASASIPSIQITVEERVVVSIRLGRCGRGFVDVLNRTWPCFDSILLGLPDGVQCT